MVEAEDPDIRDGGGVFEGISGIGNREEVCEAYLGAI